MSDYSNSDFYEWRKNEGPVVVKPKRVRLCNCVTAGSANTTSAVQVQRFARRAKKIRVVNKVTYFYKNYFNLGGVLRKKIRSLSRIDKQSSMPNAATKSILHHHKASERDTKERERDLALLEGNGMTLGARIHQEINGKAADRDIDV
jgi:hypothetical protein